MQAIFVVRSIFGQNHRALKSFCALHVCIAKTIGIEALYASDTDASDLGEEVCVDILKPRHPGDVLVAVAFDRVSLSAGNGQVHHLPGLPSSEHQRLMVSMLNRQSLPTRNAGI